MMTRYRWPHSRFGEPASSTKREGVQKGHRVVVVCCDDTIIGNMPYGNDGAMFTYDGETGQLSPVFHRAYVDRVDHSAGELAFTICRPYKPFQRTQIKGVVKLRDEGTMWMQGWSEPALAALAAAYTLKDGTP